MRISVDEDRCVAGGQCVTAAEDVFDQRDEDGVVVLLRDSVEPEAVDRVRRAAALCPAQAILLTP